MSSLEPPAVAESSRAVFLSYASQDAEAAYRICEALRAGGVEVWFDRSELRGGDAWDRTIRRQIRACWLFIPVISRHTPARDEGYFRLEWKLAVDRSYLMSANRTFLLPVVIDDTPEGGENVPDRFTDIHWTRLVAGETPTAFVERVLGLVRPAQLPAPAASRPFSRRSASQGVRDHGRTARRARLSVVALVAAVAACLVGVRFVASKPGPPAPAPIAPTSLPADASAPPHSIAVLPLLNLSAGKEDEYFSDGLTEELLNSLASIEGLRVAARTSAFSFRSGNVDVATIARTLHVATVLQGSVRRGNGKVRITAQLIDAQSGFHLWSTAFDRDLSDVLEVQTEIATSVAEALKVTILGDVGTRIELGGTRVPAAFDAYLRGRRAHRRGAPGLPAAIDAYTEALRLDPHYALALAMRSLAFTGYAGDVATRASPRAPRGEGLADARQALALCPELAAGYMALGAYLGDALEFVRARDAYRRARSLAPGDAQVLLVSGLFGVLTGESESGLPDMRRAVVLDPMNPQSHLALSRGLFRARRYADAVAEATEALRLDPGLESAYGDRGLAQLALGEVGSARDSCERVPDHWLGHECLAMVLETLGRHAEALKQLESLQAQAGDGAAYQYATIYAQWGDRARALQWLETSLRMRDPGLIGLKTDPLMGPLRAEPRFRKVLRDLKFPDSR
jgi:TolB-like protein/Flp pilus assembly protein TadD